MITKENIVGNIVAQNYQASIIFNRFKIDYCCNGNRTLGRACNEQNIPIHKVLEALNALLKKKGKDDLNYDAWSIDFLADFIYENHHLYIEQKIPLIKSHIEKICSVHGSSHPELFEIQSLFKESAAELTMHMKKEELLVFPFIKKMMKEKKKHSGEKMNFPKMEETILLMQSDHDDEGKRFREISDLTNNYRPPKDACNTYKTTLLLLKEFQEDLHKHIHLENNILFKKALKLKEALEN